MRCVRSLSLVAMTFTVLALGGCYMQDREAFRPGPYPAEDVMADLQRDADVAAVDPLAGWSR